MGISFMALGIEKIFAVLLFFKLYSTVQFIRDSGIQIPMCKILVFAYLVAY